MSFNYPFKTEEEMQKALGGNIANLRGRKEWSIRDLCQVSQVPVGIIKAVERGDHSPLMSTVFKLAKALEEPLWRLFVPDQRMLDE